MALTAGIGGNFKLARRRVVRRAGRRIIKAVADLMVRQSRVADRPVHDARDYSFIAGLEAGWETVRAEVTQLLKQRAQLPSFHQISPDQKYISQGDHWKVFILYGFGVAMERNCARCPETARLLKAVPGLQSAWFSILAPHYQIPRHRGVTKSLLRAHLGLIVPADRDRCWMRVEEQIVRWEPGKCVVFDDFYHHEVCNDTDEQRVVLIFDFVRPMRALGRLVNSVLMWGIKRSAYFKDAERNLKTWDDRLESAVQTADKMLDEAPAS